VAEDDDDKDNFWPGRVMVTVRTGGYLVGICLEAVSLLAIIIIIVETVWLTTTMTTTSQRRWPGHGPDADGVMTGLVVGVSRGLGGGGGGTSSIAATVNDDDNDILATLWHAHTGMDGVDLSSTWSRNLLVNIGC
jgi:hypothetical protein